MPTSRLYALVILAAFALAACAAEPRQVTASLAPATGYSAGLGSDGLGTLGIAPHAGWPSTESFLVRGRKTSPVLCPEIDPAQPNCGAPR